MYVKMSHISPAIVFVLKYVCKTLTLVLCNTSGVVLFPEATLPLRIIQPSFLAAVERALNQANAPSTIGVIRVYREGAQFKYASVGTTAEVIFLYFLISFPFK
jgi:Lon protease-like protein